MAPISEIAARLGVEKEDLIPYGEEIRLVQERAEQHKVRFAESRHFAEGGAGSTDLARQVMAAAENKTLYKPLYDLDIPVVEKVLAQDVKYLADGTIEGIG